MSFAIISNFPETFSNFPDFSPTFPEFQKFPDFSRFSLTFPVVDTLWFKAEKHFNVYILPSLRVDSHSAASDSLMNDACRCFVRAIVFFLPFLAEGEDGEEETKFGVSSIISGLFNEEPV